MQRFGWRAIGPALLPGFVGSLLGLAALLSPLFQYSNRPKAVRAERPPSESPRLRWRQVLRDVEQATYDIGRRVAEFPDCGTVHPVFVKVPALAAVLVYRYNTTLIAACYPQTLPVAVPKLTNKETLFALRKARHDAWIIPTDKDASGALYYASPIVRRGHSRAFAVGIVNGASLNEQARRLAPEAEREVSLWYLTRQRPSQSLRHFVLLAGLCLLLLGTALPAWRWLALRQRNYIEALIRLTRSYGDRRFGERQRLAVNRALQPLEVALHEMAEKLVQSDKELIRRERLEGALSRFFPPAQAAEIAAGKRALDLNGQRHIISVVFVHIVGYSDFVRNAPPTQVVALLQELFGLVAELSFRQGGVMDKSVGDCMVALFGAHELQADHAQRALAAAEDIGRFVQANAPRWQKTYDFEVGLALGVSSGEAIIGDLGSEAGLEYTAVGEVLSAAARLAALSRPSQILVSSDVTQYLHTPADFEFNVLSEQPLLNQSPLIQVMELA